MTQSPTITPSSAFYITGGTLPPEACSYVTRQADADLYDNLLAGEYCYVLNSRQMGKSSLCVRTVARLRQAGVQTAFVDLTKFGGKNLSAEQWYAGLLSEIGRELGLRGEFLAFWKEQAAQGLGPLQRLFAALTEVALPRIAQGGGRVVVFIDEIDVTRSLPFSTDEFFAAIRQLYVGRASNAALKQLSVCLLGTATPAELIQDTRTSPFNIGRRVELRDFTAGEAAPLAEGLNHGEHGEHAEHGGGRGRQASGANLLNRALYWTGGHPYLTQRLCRSFVEKNAQTVSDVDTLCRELFLTHTARESDDNLAFVRNRLLKSEADLAGLLDMYRHMRAGRRVADDETNPLTGILKLSGVARVEDGGLRVRNRIYEHVFDRAWVDAHMPDAERRRQKAAFKRGVGMAGAAMGVILGVIGGLAGVAVHNAQRAEVSEKLATAKASEALSSERLARASEERARDNAQRAQSEAQRANKGEQRARDNALLAQTSRTRAEQQATLARRQTGIARRETEKAVRQEARAETLAGQRADALKQKEQYAHRQADALRLATLERGRADRAAQSETRQRQGAQRLLYPNLIARAQQALSQINMPQAQKYLRQIAVPSDPALDPRGFEYRYLAAQCHDFSERTLVGSQDSVQAVAYAPDGARIACLSADHVIHFWDARTGEPGKRFTAPGIGRCLTFSPDGHSLLAGCGGRTVIWDAESGLERDSLPALDSMGKPLAVLSFAWSPDGQTLACGLHSGAVDLWDMAAPRNTKTATLRHVPNSDEAGASFPVNGVAFSPDGKTLATGCGDYDGQNATKLWDVASRRELATLGVSARGHAGWGRVNSVAFSPDGRYLVTAAEDQTVRVWNIATRTPLALSYHANNVTGVVFSPDKHWMATSSDDGTVRLWDASGMTRSDRPREAAVLYGHGKGVKCVAFAPDSHTLISGGLDKTVKVWDIARVVRPAFRAEEGVVDTIAYSRDGSRIVTSGSRVTNNFAHVWDARTFALVCTTPAHPTGVVAALSPDGKRLALAGEDKTLTLCDANTGGVTAHFVGVQEPLTTVAWSPDGKWIATGGRGAGYHPRLWDAVTHKEMTSFARQQGHLGWVLSLAFSPDSRMLVSGGGAGELRWWDTVTQKEIGPPPRQVGGQTVTSDFAHQQNIFALAFSPDGKYLVTGSEDNTARLWDTRTRQPIHLMPGHTDIVYAAAFSPDGKTLVTGGKDGTIKMWALSTLRDNILQDTVTLRGDREGVSSLAFSPDGATLAAGHKSGVVVLWQGERALSTPRPAPLAQARK